MTSRSRQPAPPPGLRVGGYRLLAKIGEGGMGIVHLAQGPDGNRVALKVLRPHVVGDDEARERLAREVASLRRVRSPRIAEVLDADPWGTTPFVATRYVPGLSLDEHVRRQGPIGGEDLRHFAAGLADALLAVHSVGVLHRDIKPSNVLLEGRAPVLIDFGLARLADDPRLTVTGWLLGTPGYLAPEILYGEDATTASDVHAWAATVAFAALGRPPFGRGPAMAVMDRVRRGEHDLTGAPTELLPLLRSALAADPSGRPTLPAVLADLGPSPWWGGRRPVEQATMPLALAPRRFDPEVRTVAETIDAGASATQPLTEVHPAPGTPYLQPSPRSAQGGAPRVRRALTLTGLLWLLALGFALSPYLCLAGLAITTLAVRTWSWTSEAARERVCRRGRHRWYDRPLAAATVPWYLLVATGGTLVLLLSAVTLTFSVGVALLVVGTALEPALVAMGLVLACTTWWGPGGRRVRSPTRALVLRLTWAPAPGWTTVLGVAVAACAAGFLLLTHGVSWAPEPGPPWRNGTPLGHVLRLL